MVETVNLIACKWVDPESEFYIEQVAALGQPPRFAIRRPGGDCLNKKGLWEWEPLPSSRNRYFLVRCRWETLDEASAALQRARERQRELDKKNHSR